VGGYLYGCGAIVSAHNSSGHFRIERDDADAVLRSIPIASIWERRKEGGVNIYADLLIGAVLYVGAIMGWIDYGMDNTGVDTGVLVWTYLHSLSVLTSSPG
jgi:hypothetical protein